MESDEIDQRLMYAMRIRCVEYERLKLPWSAIWPSVAVSNICSVGYRVSPKDCNFGIWSPSSPKLYITTWQYYTTCLRDLILIWRRLLLIE